MLPAPVVWLPQQGRAGLRELAPLNNDHLAPDTDTPREVFILVRGPRDCSTDTREDLHWSLGWLVSNAAWRQITIHKHYGQLEPPPQPRYVYWGAHTKTEKLSETENLKFSLGSMTLEQRRETERLALTVRVAEPNGRWNCQHWIQVLLLKILDAGLITQRAWDSALAGALHAWNDQMPANQVA